MQRFTLLHTEESRDGIHHYGDSDTRRIWIRDFEETLLMSNASAFLLPLPL